MRFAWVGGSEVVSPVPKPASGTSLASGCSGTRHPGVEVKDPRSSLHTRLDQKRRKRHIPGPSRGVLSGGPLEVGWGFQPGDPDMKVLVLYCLIDSHWWRISSIRNAMGLVASIGSF